MKNQKMSSLWTLITLVLGLLIFHSCGESQNTDLVETGTYNGVAEKVVPGKLEIYLRTTDDELLELYFTDQTQLTRNGEDTPFSSLSEGATLEVQIERIGNRLEPVHVKILTQ